MNARFDICQAAHDAKLPPMVSESQQEIARAEWLYNAVEDLMRGTSVAFQRRMHSPQAVTMADFDLAVDAHVNRRLADCEVGSPALGRLLNSLAAGRLDKTAEIELLGHSDHIFGMRGEIAESLLEPLADNALKAQAEDAEL